MSKKGEWSAKYGWMPMIWSGYENSNVWFVVSVRIEEWKLRYQKVFRGRKFSITKDSIERKNMSNHIWNE